MPKMRAALLYGIKDLRLEEIEIPKLKRGEILVRVRAATTCGTDLKIYTRGYVSDIIKYPQPFGHEWAGDVVEVGEGVQGIEEGMRIRAGNSTPCYKCPMCQVRCHRSITHKHRFEPINPIYENFERMLEICNTLRAEFLHVQTPPSFAPTKQNVERIREFLSSVHLRGVKLALEVRWTGSKSLLRNLEGLMEDYGITHCVDISREDPLLKSDVLYTRLFGKGPHNVYQFTDEELDEIHRKVRSGDYKKAYLTFHGVKMYKDAARFKIYTETGKFPKVTGATGLLSLKEVLSEDARFPCTKRELIQHQGWKLIDITSEKRIRAAELLKKLPDKVCHNIDQVIHELSVLGS